MRKKLLINILSLLFFFVLVFALIWPKISETLETRKKQTVLKEKITILDRKTEKVESLSQELEKNITDQKTIFEYLPFIREDDFLINYLDNVAYVEGLSLSNIGIKKKAVAAIVEIPPQPLPENNSLFSQEESALLSAVSPEPVFETVKFGFLVNYEKVTALLRRLDGLKRFNKIAALKIVKVYPQDNKEDASLDFLQVDLSLDFNHLKKITSQTEIGQDVFNMESFDQETLTKIKNRAINGASDINSTTDGRKNPFIP